MIVKQSLGNLTTVNLRDVWAHEAHDFTTWLAEEENLALLGDSIGIEMELIETESSVGSFNADIYAVEVGSGRKIVIENQLEDTNHDHLGKIITYAAGKGAEVVIWVVAHARDEHKQAIEWLNEHTDNDFGFFLVEIEVWRIGESDPAPRFNIVERPNDWAKLVKLSSGSNEGQQLKLAYWNEYHDIAEQNAEFMKLFKPRKPSTDHWTTLSCGNSKYHIALLIATQKNRIGIEFYVPDDKEIGHKAIEQKARFEQALGLEARVFDAKKASGLRFYKSGCNIKNRPEKWHEYISTQLDWAIKLRAIIDELGLQFENSLIDKETEVSEIDRAILLGAKIVLNHEL